LLEEACRLSSPNTSGCGSVLLFLSPFIACDKSVRSPRVRRHPDAPRPSRSRVIPRNRAENEHEFFVRRQLLCSVANDHSVYVITEGRRFSPQLARLVTAVRVLAVIIQFTSGCSNWSLTCARKTSESSPDFYL